MSSQKEGHRSFDDKDLPIVLVHGTMGKSEDWSKVVSELSNSRSVIRPNYIARAAARNSTNELAIKDLADEVVAAVRAEGKQRFDLVGGSLGAALAACIAAEYPEMVRSLVLVSGFGHGSDPRMNLQFKLWLRLASTDKVAFTKLLLVSGLSPTFLSAFENPLWTASSQTLSPRLTGARLNRPSRPTSVWTFGTTPRESSPRRF
jgi:pimeloyl-ACP methyl ester carboxylesterase